MKFTHWIARAVAWIVAIVAGLTTIFAILDRKYPAALCFAAIAALAVPPLWVKQNGATRLPVWARAIFGLIAFTIAGASLPNTPSAETSASHPAPHEGVQDTATVPADTAPSPSSTASGNWTYTQDKDEMRGTTVKYAQTESTNQLDLGEPYGVSNGELILRSRPSDSLAVIMSITGQFVCNEFEGQTINVKFDNRPIEHYGCSEPNDGSTGILFIRSPQRFVSHLRKATKVTIETRYFQNGAQQLTFNARGLNW